MAIYMNKVRFDLTIKKYDRTTKDMMGGAEKIAEEDAFNLKEKTELKDISLAEALQKLVKFVTD